MSEGGKDQTEEKGGVALLREATSGEKNIQDHKLRLEKNGANCKRPAGSRVEMAKGA